MVSLEGSLITRLGEGELMTRKDYKLIAKVIKFANDNRLGVEDLPHHLAHYLQLDNPRFDYDKFVVACKGE